MRKRIPIVLLFCLLMQEAVAQPIPAILPVLHYTRDTLGYIQDNFISQKEYYVGKPLRVLLKDLQIPVRSYLIAPEWSDRFHFSRMMLSFYLPDELSTRIANNRRPLIIHLEFERKLSQDSALSLRKQSCGNWLPAEDQFYSGEIIKDIVLTDYSRHHALVPLLGVDTTGYQYVDLRVSFQMKGRADGGASVVPVMVYPAGVDPFLDKLHNNDAKFKLVLVMSREIVMDAGGKPSGNLLQPVSLDMSEVRQHYPRLLLIGRLVRLLDDEERDYYANLLLYSLTGMSCSDFDKWSTREKWLERNPDNALSHRKTDIRMWKGYLASLSWAIGQGSIF